ncbi:MAG TPA: NADH-quinone oxidoreductase subunit NuoH [Candidatus Korarchaeota archaeon]|nr:NADH-quinone oxidoreductase subunit NuoH [Candidatus Korarchaeota archaeon]
MSLSDLLKLILDLLFSPWLFVPLIFPGLITVFLLILFIIWFERKIAAKVQLRYGPLYVLKQLGGAIQLVADLLRYLFAEPIVPEQTDKLAFVLGPIFLFAVSYIPSITIPVSSSFYAIRSDIGLLISLGLLTFGPAIVLVIGWASNNKFSLIGGLREGYLTMAYEIPLFISALSMAALYGTMDLVEMVEVQSGWTWGIILNPLAAITFLILSFMSTSRFPFEIVEAESEIVMGPFTEYSGILYGLTMGASYAKFYVLCLLFSIMFLGGWQPVPSFLSWSPVLPGVILLIKSLVIMAFGVFLRSVYPRYRIDQALKMGWHMILPLSIGSVFLSLGLIVLGVVP